jgi:hypothetical protein
MSTATATAVFTVVSCKGRIECDTLTAAITAAIQHDTDCQPAFGTEVHDADGETVWSSDWTEYHYRTDGDSGVIYAEDFDAACEQLDAMFSEAVIADGGFGIVTDTDGAEYVVAPQNQF